VIVTGEREYPALDGTLEGIDPSHLARYQWARQFVEGKFVADLACGCGYGAKVLRYPDGFRTYWGADYDPQAVRYGERFYGGPMVGFMCVDLQNLGHVSLTERIEVCVSFETIEHLQHPGAFLEWLRLNCNQLIMSTPIKGGAPQSPFHVQEFSVGEFHALISQFFNPTRWFWQAGVEIEEMTMEELSMKSGGVAIVIGDKY
jgi:2-polyprenyl-3-methyl-5-hydroxy-6-metoxy-1,4-benzoquinol methylase